MKGFLVGVATGCHSDICIKGAIMLVTINGPNVQNEVTTKSQRTHPAWPAAERRRSRSKAALMSARCVNA
jgi:hypothetical protein